MELFHTSERGAPYLKLGVRRQESHLRRLCFLIMAQRLVSSKRNVSTTVFHSVYLADYTLRKTTYFGCHFPSVQNNFQQSGSLFAAYLQFSVLAFACESILTSFSKLHEDLVCCFKGIFPWAISVLYFHIISACDKCTWRIMRLTMYSTDTVVSSFAPFFSSLTAFCCSLFLYSGAVVSYGTSVTCDCVGDSVRRTMEIVFEVPSSWIVTVWNWKLSTPYGTDVNLSNFLYRQFFHCINSIWCKQSL